MSRTFWWEPLNGLRLAVADAGPDDLSSVCFEASKIVNERWGVPRISSEIEGSGDMSRSADIDYDIIDCQYAGRGSFKSF
jgi:hypothetical protein